MKVLGSTPTFTGAEVKVTKKLTNRINKKAVGEFNKFLNRLEKSDIFNNSVIKLSAPVKGHIDDGSFMISRVLQVKIKDKARGIIRKFMLLNDPSTRSFKAEELLSKCEKNGVKLSRRY